MANYLRRKPLGVILTEAKADGEESLARTLGPWSLTALGVGAVIGAGIFVMSGLGAQYAGPGLMLSFIISGLGCAFAALCYAEFAAMIPLAGSAYTYAYATMGELFAWIIGWDLTLEYAMGASTVSSGWSNNFVEFLRIFHLKLPLWLCYDHWTALGVAKDFVARQSLITAHPELALGSQGYLQALDHLKSAPSDGLMAQAHAYLNAPHFFGHEFGLNFPAFLIAMAISYILAIGIKESAKFNGAIVIIKVSIVLFVIFMGIHYVTPSNWGHDWTSFAPNGIGGIWKAASYVFFAYIGFDAVSTTAQEAKNPQRDLPIGIIASLVVCTLLYVAVAAVLTGMVPWHAINIEAPLSRAFEDRNLGWAANIVTCGALAGLTSVMLVMLLGQTRVLYAMASDGLLPRKVFGEVHPKYKTPFKNTILVGLVAASVGSLTPIDDIGKMVNIGTLLAFVIVCIAITIMRFTEPDQERPFHTPGIFWGGKFPLVPILGVFFNGYMMCNLGVWNWVRLIVWLIIGLFVYFLYSVKHSKVQALPLGTR
jgi:APA family basic amino acid/polyamine antiporter